MSEAQVLISANTTLPELRSLLASPELCDTLTIDTLLQASEIAYVASDYGIAVSFMELVVAREPNVAAYWVRLGYCAKLGGNLGIAEKAFMSAIVASPEMDHSYTELSALRAECGNIGGAVAILIEQRKACGYSEALQSRIVSLLGRQGRFSDALRELRILLERDLPHESAFRMFMEFSEQSGRVAEAVGAAERLSTLYPTWGNSLALAQILCRVGRYEEALPVLVEVSERIDPPQSEVYRLLSRASVEAGRMREALEYAIRATEISPDMPICWHEAAELAKRMGRTDLALEFIGRALALDTENLHLMMVKAEMLTSVGRVREALLILDAATEFHPGNPRLQNMRLELLGGPGEGTPASVGGIQLLPLPVSRRRRLENGRDKSNGVATFLNGLKVELRVIYALVMRELSHRAERSRFGPLAAVIEPLMQIVMLGLVLSIFNSGLPPIGTSLFFFYSTGVLPFYLLLHIVNHTQNLYSEQQALLSVPRIKRLDLAIAACLAELLVGAMTTTVVYLLFFGLGYGEGRSNIIQAVYAYAAVWLFASGVGLIGAAMSSITTLWAKSWQTIQRVLYFISGVFFIPQMMPDWAREILIWNPLLIGIEWFRTGFFQNYSPPWIDKPYLLMVSFAMILVGVSLERVLRRKTRSAY